MIETLVQKRQLQVTRRVVRAGEEDAPVLKECAAADCRALFLPYIPQHKYCSPKCSRRASSKRRRAYHRRYNREWRERQPAERLEKYARHDRRRRRAQRAAAGAVSRPDRWIENKGSDR